jgi:hypothetical protein
LNCQQSTVYCLLLQWRHFLYSWLVCLALIGTENGIIIMDHGWCMKSIAVRVHLSPQRIGCWSLEKSLLHGNVHFPCNRLSISTETYSYFCERCTLWSIVWRIFVPMGTTRFVMRRFFCGLSIIRNVTAQY